MSDISRWTVSLYDAEGRQLAQVPAEAIEYEGAIGAALESLRTYTPEETLRDIRDKTTKLVAMRHGPGA